MDVYKLRSPLYNLDFVDGGNVMLRIAGEALTFDDVLLLPAHSKILPTSVSLETRIARSVGLKIPLMFLKPLDNLTGNPISVYLIIPYNFHPAS